jgi:hypothetical protein
LIVVAASPEISPFANGEISGDANGELIGVGPRLEKTGTPAGVSGCSRFPCDLGLAIALVKAFPVGF